MNSFVKYLILVCLSGLLAQPSEQGTPKDETWDGQYAGSWYRDAYKTVNDYLVENVGSAEPMSANMDAVMTRLNSDETPEREKKALRKLAGLKITEGRCDQISYEALQDNDEATEKKSHDVTSKKSAPRRIDKLVNYYATQHAISCQKKTESLFKPILKLLDRQVLRYVSGFIDPMIERILADFQPPNELQVDDDFAHKVFHAIIKRGNVDPYVTDVEHAYNTIKILAEPEDEKHLRYYSNEKTGRRTFDQREVGIRMFVKYIEDPCAVYRKHTGELFERADFDAIYHHDVNKEDPLFYRGWAYYRICKSRYLYAFWPYNDLQAYAKKIADKEEEED